jgi:hypothetical protein
MERLKILKTDTDTVSKFREDDRKLRVDFWDNVFHLYATKQNSRYFHHVMDFDTLEEAESFIYTELAYDYMP